MIHEVIKEKDFSIDEKKQHTNEMKEHYFLNVAKANLFDILMDLGWIKKSHIEYGIRELDEIDRVILKNAWDKNEYAEVDSY